MSAEDLRRLAGQDLEITDLLSAFEEVDLFYRQAIEAMYVTDQPLEPVRNSAEVTLSLEHEESTAFEIK